MHLSLPLYFFMNHDPIVLLPLVHNYPATLATPSHLPNHNLPHPVNPQLPHYPAKTSETLYLDNPHTSTSRTNPGPRFTTRLLS